MRIIADENIPFVREAFAPLGEVATAAGRDITPALVRDADILLVRSVTRVDAALLDGSRVRFVGTATIGTDHVDTAHLARRGTAFSSAPGSNAESVAQYVVAALDHVAERLGLGLDRLSIGVIGVGNVGGRVARDCRGLGMRVLPHDPPRERAEGGGGFVTLDEALQADIVTMHVPLTRSGPDATANMADAAFFRRMRRSAVFVNTARGGVMDQQALAGLVAADWFGAVVLDVWRGEPEVDARMLRLHEGCVSTLGVAVATPHIAGYSQDGKVRGTEMLYRAVCEWMNVDPDWDPASALPPPPVPALTLRTEGRAPCAVAREAVRAVYDIRRDDEAFRAILDVPEEGRAAFFDQLRRDYPVRREFSNTRVRLEPHDADAAAALGALGFVVGDK